MNKKIFFLINYYNNFKKLLSPSLADINKMLQVQEILKIVKKKNKKILIFGNGGSASIASHVSVDLIKNVKIKCINFNEANLLTCFSNDFGYENWMKKAVEYYGDKEDVLIVISSSGQSQNVNKAVVAAKNKKFSKIITFSGFKRDNPLRKKGDINFWVNSKIYNYVENIHQIMLLSIIDALTSDLKNKQKN
tara:strand:+ start:1133 stop:1708 length:576 start_codon:yes stop_codon:yes gene_type:complete